MRKKLIVVLSIAAVIAATVLGVVPALADTPGPLDHVTITPTAPTIVAGATQQFTTQAYDSANVAIPGSGLTFAWTATAGGTISTTGEFTASATPGTYNDAIHVSVAQNIAGGTTTRTATASVVITAAGVAPEFTQSLNAKKIMGLFDGFFGQAGFANFLGGQWTVKEGAATNTYEVIPGVVQTVSASSVTITPNGLAAPATFALTGATVLPKGTTLAAGDNVVIVTVNDVPKYALKITAKPASTADDDEGNEPPGLKKQDGPQGPKTTPPGWDKGKKTGWSKDQSVKNQSSRKNDD